MSYPESCNYNPIGQLIENKAEQIQYFYNASGLVTEVWYEGSPKVKFMYNDRNHRVKKESFHNDSLLNSTFYVRDVAGQVMAIYNSNVSSSGSQGEPYRELVEQPIYGAGRIGVQYTNGLAVYELTDHLGKVRALFTKESATDSKLEGYTDYYPFGMPMPSRVFRDANQYRYAFQGQEKDSETGKEAFELRLWDSRIGRWLTTDPYWEFASPYLGMGNNPISLTDPDGGCTTCNQLGNLVNSEGFQHAIFAASTGSFGAMGLGGILDEVIVSQGFGDQIRLFQFQASRFASNNAANRLADKLSARVTEASKQHSALMQPIVDDYIKSVKPLYEIQAQFGGSGIGLGPATSKAATTANKMVDAVEMEAGMMAVVFNGKIFRLKQTQIDRLHRLYQGQPREIRKQLSPLMKIVLRQRNQPVDALKVQTLERITRLIIQNTTDTPSLPKFGVK